MKEQFVTYEIALKLKELDFDEECFSAYTESGNLMDIGDYSNDDKIGELDGHSYYIFCLAPLYQQVIDWFREKHKINIIIMPCVIPSNEIKYYIFKGKLKWNWNELYNSDKEAREQAILKAIELIKK